MSDIEEVPRASSFRPLLLFRALMCPGTELALSSEAVSGMKRIHPRIISAFSSPPGTEYLVP